MVFFQLNVTGLLFQSFRTASPNKIECILEKEKKSNITENIL